MSKRPAVVFATPRKLPKPGSLQGRVVVLDIAFAADGTGTSFEKVTEPFLRGLGDRLAAWIDHHDHALHSRFADDPRFLLRKKSQHGACPEMITRERVQAAGEVNTIVCHNDLDGLYAAAKWIRGGDEPYEGADADARAVDTRTGALSTLGSRIDDALRARPREDELRANVVDFLVGGARDAAMRNEIEVIAREFATQEANARTLAAAYKPHGSRAVIVDASGFAERVGPYDKTLALLLGQEKATMAILYDEQTVTVAAPFDSGIDLLALLGIAGGMPTRVSVPRSRLSEVLVRLG